MIGLTTSTSITAVNGRIGAAGKTKVNSWNKEQVDGDFTTSLWDDGRYAHIWASDEGGTAAGDRGYFPYSSGATNPSMTVNPAGELFAAWGYLGAQQVRRQSNTNKTAVPYVQTDVINASDKMVETDMHISAYKTSSNADVEYRPITSFNALNSNAGAHNESALGGIGVNILAAPASDGGAISGQRYWAMKVPANGKIDQFQNARVTSYWNGTYGNGNITIHSSAYDKYAKTLRYASIAAPAGTATNGQRITVDSSGDVGWYSAIDLTTADHKPVIAYYDRINDTLKLAYSSATDGANGTWTIRNVMAPTDQYYTGSGMYVSMRIDSGDNIHLAFYHTTGSTNAVIYAKGTATGIFTTCKVDDAGTVGAWTDVSLDTAGNPWITYQDLIRTSNTDGVKIAFYNNGTGVFQKTSTDDYGKDNTGWEVMSVPTAGYAVIDDRLSIECKPSAATTKDWDAAVGYLSSDYIRLAYYTNFPATPGLLK
jgi:hypothetical protein